MNEIVLAASPSVVKLYGRAAVGARRHGDELPDSVCTLADQLIDRDRLANYERLCAFAVSDVLPPTYLHLLAFPLAVRLMTERAFPLPLVGLLHVANSITVTRPVLAAEPVTVRVHAEDLRAHPAGRQFDVVAEVRVAEETVWHARSTYLRRKQDRPREPKRPSPRDERPDVTSLVQLPASLGRRYAAVSGDRNPIHLSKGSARLFGFPSAIAHGMWLVARTLALPQGRLPDAFTVDVAFKRPVLLPSTVAISTAKEADGWALAVRNARTGTPHLRGTIR